MSVLKIEKPQTLKGYLPILEKVLPVLENVAPMLEQVATAAERITVLEKKMDTLVDNFAQAQRDVGDLKNSVTELLELFRYRN